MSEARVLLEVKNKIAYVSLNRPEKHNGLDMAMFKEMIATAKKIRKNRAIRAVIMHGNGPSFCAGLDSGATCQFPLFLPSMKLLWWGHANYFGNGLSHCNA